MSLIGLLVNADLQVQRKATDIYSKHCIRIIKIVQFYLRLHRILAWLNKILRLISLKLADLNISNSQLKLLHIRVQKSNKIFTFENKLNLGF